MFIENDLRADTDSLKNTGGLNHVGRSGEAKVVDTWLNWSLSSSRDSSRELRNMSGFSLANRLESGDFVWSEAESSKVRVCKLLEALGVERRLEMLKGKRAAMS